MVRGAGEGGGRGGGAGAVAGERLERAERIESEGGGVVEWCVRMRWVGGVGEGWVEQGKKSPSCWGSMCQFCDWQEQF